MNTETIVKQVKQVIMQELLAEVNDKECILDLYIEGKDNKDCELSKVTKNFLEQRIKKLIEEHRSGRILFFRKYNYEKILNEYLERKYNIAEIEMNLFPSEKKKHELEEKHKQELHKKQLKEQEEKIINEIPYLKWEKSIRVSGITYEAVNRDNKKIELHYIVGTIPKKIKHKNTYNKLLFDNQPLQYAEYNVNAVVKMIEKSHPKNVKADHIIVVNRKENSKIEQKVNVDNQSKEKEKTDEEKIAIFAETKKQYRKYLGREYGIGKNRINEICKLYQNECKYLNRDVMVSCTLNNRPCTVFYADCPYNKVFLNSLKETKRMKLQKNIDVFAEKYNITPQKVKNIAERYKKQCSYYIGVSGKCCFNEIISSVCSLQHDECIFHDKFIESIEKYLEEDLARQQKNESSIAIEKKEEIKRIEPVLPEIGLKDFVVRRNVFKCMHNKHEIDNVVAMINIDDDGKKQQIKISAGYCSQCKVYFILDSTYQSLKKKGMILCRITDEKNYMRGAYVNGMLLAQESVLMQYGYTVSQTEGLSATSRQKILAVIIDNRIMAKSEIISYLDFFISQRSSRSNMEIAISKWEADREFVENYRLGEYTQFGVKAIYRR